MDGGRRLLRSLKEALGALAPTRPAFAGAAGALAATSGLRAAAPAPRRRRREARASRLLRYAQAHGVGSALAVCVLGGAGALGAFHGGEYQKFVAENGSIGDSIARAMGFGIEAVSIAGARELHESEILAAGGIDSKSSLLFVDVNAVRARLAAMPLVQDVSVRKLFPNRLIVDITEREPFAIWQKGGVLKLVASDGAPIAEMHDARFAGLPFVVGEGANLRIAEFRRIVEAAGDLQGRVRAGVLIGQRRWNLVLSSGLEVKLPALAPEAAAAQLGRLARDSRLLDKDLLSVDFRVPGRIFARMTDEAAAARAENLPHVRKRGPA